MKFHYVVTLTLIFVFVSSCTQQKIVATSIPATGTPTPLIVTPQPSSSIETGTASPETSSPSQTSPSFPGIPYNVRQYKLVNTCNVSACLFIDNVSQPSYPIGYAIIVGHYIQVERTRDSETETCDGFVIDSAPQELLTAYENHFMDDTAVYSKALDGKSVINIPLWNEDEATKEIIFSSSAERPVTLHVLNEPPIYYGTVSCFSPVSILDVTQTLTVPDLSQVYTITEADNGKVFTYTVTTRFTLALNDIKYPRSQTICLPEMIFGYIANGENQYEITKTGKCQLQNGNFHVTIIGVPP